MARTSCCTRDASPFRAPSELWSLSFIETQKNTEARSSGDKRLISLDFREASFPKGPGVLPRMPGNPSPNAREASSNDRGPFPKRPGAVP